MKTRLTLEGIEWGEFKLADIFTYMQRGKRLTKKNQKKGTRPYVSSTSLHNGIDNFISNKKNIRIFDDCLSLANSGSVGKVFYHVYSFIASDHVSALKNTMLNKCQYLFLAVAIERIAGKYSFNREINNERLKKEKILLPITPSNTPDWQFMESYMKQIEADILKKEIEYFKNKIAKVLPVKPLEDVKWGEFLLTDIADISSGIDIYAQKRILGNVPYVTSTALTNGVAYYVANRNDTFSSNCISVNRNGSVGYSFYHGYNALFSNDVRKLWVNNGERHSNIFVSMAIMMQKNKYGYGYKMGTARLKKQKILLPITPSNTPDWKYMENYMKNIEMKQIKDWLSCKKVSHD